MTEYDLALIGAMVALISSLLIGFSAITNQRSVAFSLVLFVVGGLALYYATTIGGGRSLAEDIPGAVYRLYASFVN